MKSSRILAAAALAALTGSATACGSQPAAPHAAAASPVQPPPSPATIVGFTASGLPQSWAPVTAFSKAVGHPVNLVMYYAGWGERFRTAFAQTAREHGAEVMVNLAPAGSLASIAAGDGDGYLRRLAGQIRAFGHPVILCFGHEANGDWYSYGYKHQPAAEFIAAYRHVHDVITDAGAANVTWLWTVNIPAGSRTAPVSAYWPGAAYVSEIGLDAYDWTGRESFAQELAPTIAAVRRLGTEPVIVAETSVIPGPNAASQVTGLLDGIRAEGLVGLVWFDTDKAGFKHTTDRHDWRIEDDPAALAAFRAGIRGFG
jgi:mannan endo-1,4-beta-mannosidase